MPLVACLLLISLMYSLLTRVWEHTGDALVTSLYANLLSVARSQGSTFEEQRSALSTQTQWAYSHQTFLLALICQHTVHVVENFLENVSPWKFLSKSSQLGKSFLQNRGKCFEDRFDFKQNKKYIIRVSLSASSSFPTFTKSKFLYAVFSFSVSNGYNLKWKNFFSIKFWQLESFIFIFQVHCNEQVTLSES